MAQEMESNGYRIETFEKITASVNTTPINAYNRGIPEEQGAMNFVAGAKFLSFSFLSTLWFR